MQLVDWLQQDAVQVAPSLLGYQLSSTARGARTGGIIVETEAYHGVIDPASHAYRGSTPRTSPMFEAGGTIYVYLSYGVHTCMNIVTGPAGEGQAVLIRALEPTIGLEIMAARRRTKATSSLTNGPGKLAQALGVGLAMSGTKLGDIITLEPPLAPIDPARIASGPRVGITKAMDHPWRFIRDNHFVSRTRVAK